MSIGHYTILERKNTCVNKTNHAIPLDGDLHIPFEQPGWAPVYDLKGG